MIPDDSLRSDILRRGLRTHVLGRVAHYFPECPSTNAIARALADRGDAEGALVVTDYQTAGRGRLGRSWHAPAGSSLLFSLLLRPHVPLERIAQVTMAAGLGCAAGIERAGGVRARLKWPNDVVLDGRKAGGMLSEFGLEPGGLKYVIVGIGLNVNFDPRGVEGIPPEATSLQVQLGCLQPRTPLLRAILEEMEPRYLAMCRGESLRGEWADALETLGQNVHVTTHIGTLEGRAENVEESGSLVLRMTDGSTRTILAGDVVSLK